MSDLAFCDQFTDQLEDARDIQLWLLRIQRSVLGDKHLDRLDTIKKQAFTYKAQGLLEKVEGFTQLMKGRTKVLGMEDSEMLKSMECLTHILMFQGRHKDGILLMETCL